MKIAVQNSGRQPKAGRQFFIKTAKALAVIFILILAVFIGAPQSARIYGYEMVREAVREYIVMGTWDLDKITSEHFYIKFEPKDREQAQLVLSTAELFYKRVAGDFNYSPHSRIPIIMYSTNEEFNKSFGWEANETNEGVYWAGAIQVLSPEVWVEETDPGMLKDVFISSGPMAHEITHLMVDYLAGGNYPRWFTEGVAQYEEYKITGFEFNDPAGSLEQPLYSISDSRVDFDSLPNQLLAYRESLYAVRYIASQYGEESLYDLINQLGKGEEFHRAVQNVTGLDAEQFESHWQAWALKNEN